MNKIVQLKSYNSEGIEIGDVYPVTKSEGILLTNGKHLEEKLSEIDEIKENNKKFSAQLEQNQKQQQLTPMLQSYENMVQPYRVAHIHDKNDYIYAIYSRTGSTYDLEKSTDKGVSWTKLGTLPADVKCIHKVYSTNTLIAIENTGTTGSPSNPRMWRSIDDGASWNLINAGLKFPPLSSQGICDTPNGNIVIGEYGNIGNHSYRILVSKDDGLTWEGVLASPGVDPQGDPGHIHSVTYDKYANKLIAFMDRPANSNYGARIYSSSDNGLTWQIVGIVDSNTKPNFVSPMYFETHIAWGSDNERNGVISRIKREDFYSGRFDKIEDIIKLNDKVFYFTFPIRDGVWVISMANETVAFDQFPNGAGNYANEIFIVSDNGSVVSGGFSYIQSNVVAGTLTGRRMTFPSYVYNRTDHRGLSWINLTTGQPRAYSAMPYTQGWGLPTTKVERTGTQLIPLENMTPIQGKSTDGSLVPFLGINNYGQPVFKNWNNSSGGEVRVNPTTNDVEFYSNNVIVGKLTGGGFLISKLLFAANGVAVLCGNGSPEGVVEARTGCFYLNWNGGIGTTMYLKQSGTGNTGWVPVGTNAGNTLARPTSPTLGMYYFDTTIGKPIWCKNTNPVTWVDSIGNII